jgi:hypothetical protein
MEDHLAAFDIVSGTLYSVPSLDSDIYEQHRRGSDVFECTRGLWYNRTDNYVVFIPVSNKTCVYKFDSSLTLEDVGVTVSEFKLDASAYKAASKSGSKSVALLAASTHSAMDVSETAEATGVVPAQSEKKKQKVDKKGAKKKSATPMQPSYGLADSGLTSKTDAVKSNDVKSEDEDVKSEANVKSEAVVQSEKEVKSEEVKSEEVESEKEVKSEEAKPEEANALEVAATASSAEEEDEATKLQTQIQELQQQNADLQSRTSTAEQQAADAERKHTNYKKTKQREMNHKNEDVRVAQEEKKAAEERAQRAKDEAAKELSKEGCLTAEEADTLKAQLSAAQSHQSLTEVEKSLATRKHPSVCYDKLIQLAHSAYQKMKNGQTTGTVTSPEFEFFDQNSTWSPISDPTVLAELRKLTTGSAKTVTYSCVGHQYEAHMASGKASDHCIIQKNTAAQYLTERKIRVPPVATTAAPINYTDIIFGANSVVELPSDFVDRMLSEYNFMAAPMPEISQPFAELAELFSSMANKFLYTRHVGGRVIVKSEKWVKGAALFAWLNIASGRGYTHCRLVMHGGSKKTYDGCRADNLGFDLQYRGQQGQAYGDGLYFGLSDHITVGYNQRSGFPRGSCIVGLLLTNQKIGWSHASRYNHQGALKPTTDDAYGKAYKTLSLQAPIAGVHNAIVVHEGNMVLPLGMAVATGKGESPDANVKNLDW